MRDPEKSKPTLLILDQQSWPGGAQRVLASVLDAVEDSFQIVAALPDEGAWAEELRRRGIEVWTYPLGSYQPGRKSLREAFEFALRTAICTGILARAIRKRRVRLVYINGPRGLLAGALAARLTGTPALFHLHNVLTRKVDIRLTAIFARFVSRIVACSHAAIRCLLESSPGLGVKSTVVYNCAHSDALAKGGLPARPLFERDSARRVIGLVGRITEGKGHHVLMKAVARLDASLQTDPELLFVGAPAVSCPEDEAYLQFLKQLAADLGLSERIRWAGFQANPGPYFKCMDVVVVPSVSNEGFPLVALEAMQQGLAVIASNVGGISEAIAYGETGLLVPPNDERALAEALKRVLADPELRHRLGAAARCRVDQHFSFESFKSSIRRIVVEVCGPPTESRPKTICEELAKGVKATET